MRINKIICKIKNYMNIKLFESKKYIESYYILKHTRGIIQVLKVEKRLG